MSRTAAPASLARRLSLAAAGLILVAIVVATVALGFILQRFIQGQIDGRLDGQVVFLQSLLRVAPDGMLSLSGDADGPPFDRPGHGWYWQVTGAKNALRSHALGARDLLEDVKSPPPPPHREDREGRVRPRPADGQGIDGQALHYRILVVQTPAGPVTIAASSPRAAVLGPLREALVTLALSLAGLALVLIGATWLQVRLGLRPLQRLRRDLAAVRSGAARHLPAEQPAEIAPLVDDLNALLEQNAVNLERARRHVANLAHGLKTPLATLSATLAAPDTGAMRNSQTLVEQMDRHIRHHLTRARSAALRGPVSDATRVTACVEALVPVLSKMHADKPVTLAIDIPDDLTVLCEAQDLDEIVGNILDNAFKWARSRVAIAARRDGRMAGIVIEDDGPGVQGDLASLLPGKRLDESVPGFGFGLTIARELTELYGGSLGLANGPGGGVRVEIVLPADRDARLS